jgi:mannan endo-1,4-beta-mannosidase
MTPIEDKLRAAIRARADEIEPFAPPLRLPARRRRSFFLAHGGGEKKRTSAQRVWQGWGAPAASAIMVGVVIVASAVIFGGHSASSSPVRSSAGRVTHASAPSLVGPAYLGVYPAGHGYGPVASFAKAAGRRPNIVEYLSRWDEPFPASYARTLRRHGAIVMVQIEPTFASVKRIAAGDYDSYLRSYADDVRAFGRAVIIGFGHEMNAPWYSWGYRRVPPSTFVAAWRHIVTVFHAEGAYNVTWLWTINADQTGTRPAASWWPGAHYVTWVGIDGYYYHPSDTFAGVFGHTIDQVRALTGKPVLLSDTAVAPGTGQPAGILNLFQGMRRYHTLGLVWFDQTTQGTGISHEDWRLEDSPPAKAAFRRAASGVRLVSP